MSNIKASLIGFFMTAPQEFDQAVELYHRILREQDSSQAFMCQDHDGEIYMYAGGQLQYGGDAWGWQNGSGTVRAVLNGEGEYLTLPVCSDYETSKVLVSELIDVVNSVGGLAMAPVPTLFSVDMAPTEAPEVTPQGSSVAPTPTVAVGVEVMRDRVLEIREAMEALKYESDTLLEIIQERGFKLNEGPVPLLKGVIGDTVRLFQRSNNTAMGIGKFGHITGVDVNHYDIDDTFTVCKQDVELIKE